MHHLVSHAARALAAAIALGACAGAAPAPAAPASSTAAPATSTAAPATSTAAPGLTITELKFYRGAEHGMTLHADGKLEIKSKQSADGKPAVESWSEVAVLTADGKLTHADKVGQLLPDGTFRTSEGQLASFKLVGEELVVGEQHVTIDAKGTVHGVNPSFDIRVTGLTDAGSRRTALLLLALLSE